MICSSSTRTSSCLKCRETRRAEELEGHAAADVAPEVAVGCERDGGEVVVEDFPGEHAQAVGEDDVIFGEAFFCGGRGGEQEDFT